MAHFIDYNGEMDIILFLTIMGDKQALSLQSVTSIEYMSVK